MKTAILLSAIVSGLLLTGCDSSYYGLSRSNDGIRKDYGDGVYIKTIEGHDYLFASNTYSTTVIHTKSCHCRY